MFHAADGLPVSAHLHSVPNARAFLVALPSFPFPSRRVRRNRAPPRATRVRLPGNRPTLGDERARPRQRDVLPAKERNLATGYVAARPDIEAAVRLHARSVSGASHRARRKLVFRIALARHRFRRDPPARRRCVQPGRAPQGHCGDGRGGGPFRVHVRHGSAEGDTRYARVGGAGTTRPGYVPCAAPRRGTRSSMPLGEDVWERRVLEGVFGVPGRCGREGVAAISRMLISFLPTPVLRASAGYDHSIAR